MGKFHGNDRGGFGGKRFGGKSFGHKSGGFGGGHSPRMFEATCAECGNNCRVPFQPSGTRPVYCSNCFDKQNGGEGREGRREFKPRRFEDRSPMNVGGGINSKDIDFLKKQISELHEKMDALIATFADVDIVNDADFDDADMMEDATEVEETIKKDPIVKTKKTKKKSL